MQATAEDDFIYDIFLSYNTHDEQDVRELKENFEAAGVRTFFSLHDLKSNVGRENWEESIFAALRKSVHLGVYCSKDALLSDWVRREIEEFKKHLASRLRDEDSLILVIPDNNLTPAELEKVIKVNPILKGHLRPRDSLHALQIVVERRIKILLAELDEAREKLHQAKELARQSFDYYRHARFWRPFSQVRDDLHVFTCGRDITQEAAQRGLEGRSNIDKWDYQAAVDITHHFARHHRDIGVEIEQPVSKVRIDELTRAFDTTGFSSKLADQNCIIIGSPDVSDFAEVTLAKLLGVQPYRPETELTVGFKMIKEGQAFSTFYEPASGPGREGVRLIGGTTTETFVCTRDRTYGVMVLADNPFSRRKNKILILAGHTGVATRAMSLLLTDEEPWCLEEFYGLDQTFALMRGPIAAVIEVHFARQAGIGPVGDDRKIVPGKEKIRFMAAIPLES